MWLCCTVYVMAWAWSGGGSAMKRAYEANRAEMIQHVGEFLSGELLRGDDRGPPPPPPSKL